MVMAERAIHFVKVIEDLRSLIFTKILLYLH